MFAKIFSRYKFFFIDLYFSNFSCRKLVGNNLIDPYMLNGLGTANINKTEY